MGVYSQVSGTELQSSSQDVRNTTNLPAAGALA